MLIQVFQIAMPWKVCRIALSNGNASLVVRFAAGVRFLVREDEVLVIMLASDSEFTPCSQAHAVVLIGFEPNRITYVRHR